MNPPTMSLDFSRGRKIALLITGIYLFIGLFWIALTQFLPESLTLDPTVRLQLKGWCDLLIVLVTSLILYLACRRVFLFLEQQEQNVHDMVKAVCSSTDERFFSSLLTGMTELVGASGAFICEFTDATHKKVRTVAVCLDGQIVKNLEFELAGTPCNEVVQHGLRVYQSKVQEIFPFDHLAKDLSVESYVGVPLLDSYGRVMGPMALFGQRKIRKPQLAASILQLFAARVAAELERKKAESTINYMASYDGLTGLPNRCMFTERLKEEINRARHSHEIVAVMLLDLDRFKSINDTLGHPVGDLILKGVADRLASAGNQDGCVARMGGDEFMFLFPRLTHMGEASMLASQIIESIKPAIQVESTELHVACSLGIAIFPFDGRTPETLLKNADTALYRGKAGGRNTFQFYTPDMNAMSLARLGLENHLRKALEREELVLYYQPQYDLESGRIVGLEALLRWHHPEKGLLQPDLFIPLAEETGLVEEIGEWVVEAACQQNRSWQKAGLPPVKIAVNLSARNFYRPDLDGFIGRMLEENGVQSDCLEVEITESIIMQNVTETIDKVHKLRLIGVKTSIDDFGTGYSSLSYLKQFPIHALKIDRSFIRDLMVSPGDAAIVSAIISIAQKLDLDVVAEGVETEDQLQYLRDLHCQKVQGFLFSKPLPAAAIEELLREDVAKAIALGNPSR